MRTVMQDKQSGQNAERNKRTDGYPLQYKESVRRAQRSMGRGLPLWGLVSLWLCYGFFHDWPQPFFGLAPFVTLFFLIYAAMTIPILVEIRTVCILPYFKKGRTHDNWAEPDRNIAKVEGNTFLYGKSLARNCLFLDKLALQAGLDPLSHFGFRDDLGGETVVWYEAEQGLRTVTGLLLLLEQQPHLLEEAGLIMDDLGLLEETLQSAAALRVSFCLLLRQGNTASGHEMDMRISYFA